MVVMPGTCLEGHRPKTRQALTPSTSVWVRPDTEGPSPTSSAIDRREQYPRKIHARPLHELLRRSVWLADDKSIGDCIICIESPGEQAQSGLEDRPRVSACDPKGGEDWSLPDSAHSSPRAGLSQPIRTLKGSHNTGIRLAQKSLSITIHLKIILIEKKKEKQYRLQRMEQKQKAKK